MIPIFGVISAELGEQKADLIDRMRAWSIKNNLSGSTQYTCIHSETISLCYQQNEQCFFYEATQGDWTLVVGRVKLDGSACKDMGSDMLQQIHALCRKESADFGNVKGEYLIITADESRRRYGIYRDNLGFKLMYFSQQKTALIFGTQVEGLMATKLIARDVDLFSVYSYIYMKGVPREHTMYTQIRCLPPGFRLSLEKGTVLVTPYKDLRVQPLVNHSLGECVEVVVEILKHEIADVFNGDAQVALLLSGGLDSSFLFVLMKSLGIRFSSYTVIFEKTPDFTQPSLATTRKLGEKFEMPISYPCVDAEFVLTHIVQMMQSADVPFAGGFQTYTGLLAAKQQNPRLQYLITGEGADTGLGLNRYMSFLNAIKYFLPVVRCILGKRHFQTCKAFEMNYRNRDRSRVTEILYQYAQLQSGYINWKATGLQFETVAAFFANPNLVEGFEDDLRTIHLDMQKRVPQDDYLLKDSYKNLRTYSAEQAIRPFNNVCAMQNVEMVFPFLQETYLQYCLGIPPKYKEEKLILKKAFQAISGMPDFQFKKEGFEMPMNAWLKTKMQSLAWELYEDAQIEKRGFFDKNTIHQLFRDYFEHNSGASAFDIWAFLTLEIWLQQHADTNQA